MGGGSLNVGFLNLQFGERGTEVSTFDYADYNERILGNKSIVMGTINRPHPTLQKFQNAFRTVTFKEDWNGSDNSRFQKVIEEIVKDNEIDVFYTQKGGENDFFLPRNCASVVHAVFQMREPHGNVYAGISEYLAKRDGKDLWVPYIVNLPNVDGDLRSKLKIPNDAFVIGRHGGKDTFNIPFVYRAIADALQERDNLYFIFLNTNRFITHPRVIFLDTIIHPQDKRVFINSCDAMIHARRDGETFGHAVGEFSFCNKPIITYNGPNIAGLYDRSHLEILGDIGIYYNDYESAMTCLTTIEKSDKNFDVYSKRFSPETVMKKFKEVFLD